MTTPGAPPALPPQGGGVSGPAEPDPRPLLDGAAAFDADGALVQLKRSMRDMKLAERGNHFELRGKRVLELKVAVGRIEARIARKLANTPEWDRQSVASATDQRKLQDEIKKRLARWAQED